MAKVRLAPGQDPRDVGYEDEGRHEEVALTRDTWVDLPIDIARDLHNQGVAEMEAVKKAAKTRAENEKGDD